MTPFATEFAVKSIVSESEFVAQVVAWLRGIEKSTILHDRRDSDIDVEVANLTGAAGEELRFRVFKLDQKLAAVGFRHDLPDNSGRLWRTEAVLRHKAGDTKQDLFRIRTQCIARDTNARLQTPRKPYLVKALLQDKWGGIDGIISTSDQPHWLTSDQMDIEIAAKVFLGTASRYLPIIYVCATGAAEWLLSQRQIEKLAFDLGGIAHVVVEPDRAFSFALREATSGSNPYGQTLAISLPIRGLVRRLYIGWQLPDLNELLAHTQQMAVHWRTQMPATGWDWTELQEQALRHQRERDRNRCTVQETETLYQAEIANLKDRIDQLEQQIIDTPIMEAEDTIGGVLSPYFVDKIGLEIYPGEFTDRILSVVKDVYNNAHSNGMDSRSIFVLKTISETINTSSGLKDLLHSLQQVTKEPKRAASQIVRLLRRHGYAEKSDNKHVRLEAIPGYLGLETLTIPKTPSDNRALLNLRKQIERSLGVSKLSE